MISINHDVVVQLQENYHGLLMFTEPSSQATLTVQLVSLANQSLKVVSEDELKQLEKAVTLPSEIFTLTRKEILLMIKFFSERRSLFKVSEELVAIQLNSFKDKELLWLDLQTPQDRSIIQMVWMFLKSYCTDKPRRP